MVLAHAILYTGAARAMPQTTAVTSRFWVTCYTDASYSHEGAGWGVWLRSIPGRVVRRGACPGYVRSANEAEMAAIFAALYLARKTWGGAVRGLLVHTDSQAAITFLGTEPLAARLRRRSPGIERLRGKILAFSAEHGIELDLRWVKGHQKTNTTRAFLNAACDRLAGAARKVVTKRVESPMKEAVNRLNTVAVRKGPATENVTDGLPPRPAAETSTVPARRSRKQKNRERRLRSRARKRARVGAGERGAPRS